VSRSAAVSGTAGSRAPKQSELKTLYPPTRKRRRA
jgi:hypothetical protein